MREHSGGVLEIEGSLVRDSLTLTHYVLAE